MGNSDRIGLALGLLAIVLLAGACGAAGDGPGTAGDAAEGRSRWAQSACVGCHGIQAEGSRYGPALAYTPLTLREATSITRRGGPGMPKYAASQVSDQDLRHMYAWWQNPVAATTGEGGQAPWTELGCGGCHGANGQGASAVALAGGALSYDEFQRVVRGGAEGMPAYSASRIPDTDLQRLYDWVQNPVPTATVDLGQDPWADLGCTSCHGANGQGGSGPSLARTSLPLEAFRTVVRQGARGMPSYAESRASDQTVQALYEWLKGQAPAAVEQPPMWLELGCGACHGANAEGASASGLDGEDFSFDEFQRVVRGGEEGMPAYSASQISDQDLQQIFVWLMGQP